MKFLNPYQLCWLIVLAVMTAIVPRTAAQKLEGRIQSAEQDYNQGRYKDAENKLAYVLARQPADFNANELMGLVLVAEGEETRATEPLAQAVTSNPQSITARENLAANYARRGKSALAEKQLLRLAALDPKNFVVMHNLGEFYVQAGKIMAAVPWLRKAQEIDPANYQNGYDLSLGLIQTGRLAQAEAELKSLLAVRETAELHSLLADAYEKDGKVLSAGSEYQRAAQIDPSEDTIFDWGAELLRHRNLPEARQVFSRGCSMFPQSTRMETGLGLTELTSGNKVAAVQAMLHAIDLNPADKDSYYFLAAMDRIPSDLQSQVTQRFEHYANQYPGRADAQYYYAANLWLMNQMQDSSQDDAAIEQRLQRALALDPTLYKAHNLLGIILQDHRKYQQAIHQYEAAIREKPTLDDAHYRLALLLYRLGQKQRGDEEMQQFRRLRASEKEDPIVTFLLSNQSAGH